MIFFYEFIFLVERMSILRYLQNVKFTKKIKFRASVPVSVPLSTPAEPKNYYLIILTCMVRKVRCKLQSTLDK